MSPRSDADGDLLRELSTMWQVHDPVPADLVERVLVAIATEDLDAEYEMLHLVSRSDELAGARGGSDALTISFSGESFSLMLRVSSVDTGFRRVDGWVTPVRPMRVNVRQGNRTLEADVDDHGRFEIPRLPGGLSRFWLIGQEPVADSEDQSLFATPTFEL